jgi:hypothetical protein
MNEKKSKETLAYEKAMLHPNKSKAGFLPRAAGETEIQKVPQAAPSHGVTDRNKPNTHGRKYNPYHHGEKVVLGGDDRDADK